MEAFETTELRPFVIFNPAAGSGRELDRLRELLEREIPDAVLEGTAGPGGAARLARDAIRGGWDPVVAAGGDGLVREILDGVAPDLGRARLGLLPLGTGNDLARSLGIPADTATAVRVLRRGAARRVDVGRILEGGQVLGHFLNVAVAGFVGRVADRAGAAAKRRWGSLAYRGRAVLELPRLARYRTVVAVDGEELELESYAVVVANGAYLGGGLPVAAEARLDDGLLDVVVVPALSFPRLARVVARVLLGRAPDRRDVLFRRGRRITLTVEPRMHLNADGDPVTGPAGRAAGAEGRPVTVEALPGALELIAPPAVPSEDVRGLRTGTAGGGGLRSRGGRRTTPAP